MRTPIIFSCLLFFACAISIPAFAQSDAIVKMSKPEGWIIKTKSSAYQIIIDGSNVIPVFYGSKDEVGAGDPAASWFRDINEVPVRGSFADKTPMLEVVFSDGVRDVELDYKSAEVITMADKPVLKIVQKDKSYGLEVTSYIRVLSEENILEKWCVLKNTGGSDNILLENAQSASLVLPAGRYVLHHMSGTGGHEFQPNETALTPGIKTLESRDFVSFKNPPWYMVRPSATDKEKKGPAWFGSLQYSGNWRIDFDAFYGGNVQIAGGINFWDTHWTLHPGESFETPKFISGFTNEGSEGVSQSLQAYVRAQILPTAHKNDIRPVLYNSWFVTEFKLEEKKQLELAAIAREIGIETFVIDDGWFKGRNDEYSGLGDWEADKAKFPNGLKSFIQKINAMGLQFGIWVEPEMVNPNSDLYRAHPDWIFYFPNRTRHESRHQFMLNLAREDVYQYLLASMTKLLKENNIKYLKWDHNRTLSEPGWPAASPEMQKEVRIRYLNNLYKLIKELRSRFPDVVFENCASGSGRADYGMLSLMDQNWVSDNTDPIDRILIQYGYLNLLPANTMIDWVTDENYRLPVGLDFKFDVSMSGVLGVGANLFKWDSTQRSIAKEKIEQYKRIRPIVLNGILHRLISPYEGNRCALQYSIENGRRSVVFCYNTSDYLEGSKPEGDLLRLLKLEGLQPDQSYRIEKLGLPADKQDKNTYTGSTLMNAGIAWPVYRGGRSIVLLVTATGN